MRRNDTAVLRGRIIIVLLFFCFLFAVLAGRLFIMQIISHRQYLALADRQHFSIKAIMPGRGGIFMQDNKGTLIPVAITRSFKTLAASPKNVTDASSTASFLADEFNLDRDAMLKKLTKKDDEYEVIARKVEPDQATRVADQHVNGLFFEEKKGRFYPHGTLGANVLGFVSRQDEQEHGQYGIERAYENDLVGKTKGVETSGFRRFLSVLGRGIGTPAVNGSDLVLTLDYNIQTKAEEILKETGGKWQASSGSVLVLEPKTGKILALASTPSYDPNFYFQEKDFGVFTNPVAEAMFELGSVMKPVTMASALEEDAVTPDKTYTDTGQVIFGKYTIRNFDENAYGVQTMTQVLEKSLNTGIVFAARLLGKEKQHQYLTKFGFGAKTGVDLPGEVAGNISNLNNMRDIDFATAAFGQGIAVTPLQLGVAISALANHGKLMKPYIVERITDPSGYTTVHTPTEVRSVISRETAETLTKMLISAVRNGFENRASVKGYFIAGKTGTAQIPRPDGRGYSEKLIHTFVGYAPAFDARFMITIQLNDPKGNWFAANTLTPAFHDLTEFMLNYYQIPPDEK